MIKGVRQKPIITFLNKLSLLLLVLAFTKLSGQTGGEKCLLGKFIHPYSNYNLNVEGIQIILLPDSSATFTDSKGFFQFNNIQSDTATVLFKINPRIIKWSNIYVSDCTTERKEFKIVAKKHWITEEITQLDLKNGEPRLFVYDDQYLGNHSPNSFEKDYNVCYVSDGAVYYNSPDSIFKYNQIVFKYLDEKYGTKWREEVRKDVVGL